MIDGSTGQGRSGPAAVTGTGTGVGVWVRGRIPLAGNCCRYSRRREDYPAGNALTNSDPRPGSREARPGAARVPVPKGDVTCASPQVSERIKEAPAQALRGVFAGIGQLLLFTDKLRNKAPAQVPPARVPQPSDSPPDRPAGPDRDDVTKARDTDQRANARPPPAKKPGSGTRQRPWITATAREDAAAAGETAPAEEAATAEQPRRLSRLPR